MKTVQHYICEICGTMYANEKTAKDCEAYHIKPKNVINKANDHKDWIPITQSASSFYKYPKRIKVEMQDGSIQKYSHTD